MIELLTLTKDEEKRAVMIVEKRAVMIGLLFSSL